MPKSILFEDNSNSFTLTINDRKLYGFIFDDVNLVNLMKKSLTVLSNDEFMQTKEIYTVSTRNCSRFRTLCEIFEIRVLHVNEWNSEFEKRLLNDSLRECDYNVFDRGFAVRNVFWNDHPVSKEFEAKLKLFYSTPVGSQSEALNYFLTLFA